MFTHCLQSSRLLVGFLPFAPVVEPSDGDGAPVLTQHPNEILVSGEFNKVPMIIGVNNKEGSLLFASESWKNSSDL